MRKYAKGGHTDIGRRVQEVDATLVRRPWFTKSMRREITLYNFIYILHATR
jgi:hypothetical protein